MVQAAVEVTGLGAGLDGVLDCMAKFGRVALLGCTRDSNFNIDYYRKVHGPGISLIGAYAGDRPERDSFRGWWSEMADVETIVRLCAMERIDPSQMICETHSPKQAPDVYKRLASNLIGGKKSEEQDMRKIRIAQIGTSETTHSVHIMTTMLGMPETFEVLGVADVDQHYRPLDPIFDRVPKMTVEQLLELPELDAVVIDCDENIQTEYALMAAERGLAIQMEKPGSESDVDFDRLIDLVQEKGLVFHVSYMYRYNPAIMYAMEKIQSGAIGDVYCVEAQMNI